MRVIPSPAFTETAAAGQIIDTLTVAHRNGWMVSIEGPPGIGKTTAAFEFERRRPGRIWYFATRRDTAAKGPLFKELSRAFMGAADLRTSDNVRYLSHELAERDGGLGPPVMLILDEAQNLNADTLEQLRSLYDEGHVSIAFLGNHTFADRHNSEKRSLVASPQFLSRINMHVRIGPASPADVAALARAHGLTDERLVARLAPIAAGYQGFRALDNLVTLAADFAGGGAPGAADFAAALDFLHPR